MDERRQLQISLFREAVFAKICQLTPLSDELRSRIDQRLHQELPNYKIPDHPPYSLMIQTAIAKLREERGSTEETISGFIKREYEGLLPLGHESFLSHHLTKLCREGEVAVTGYGRYILVAKNSDLGDEQGRDQVEEPRRRKRHCGNDASGGSQYSYQAEKERSEVTRVEIPSLESAFQEQYGKNEASKPRI